LSPRLDTSLQSGENGRVRTTIVIPCYNEEARLDLAEFERHLGRRTDLRLLFVNDGSSDGTAALIGAFARRFPERVELLDLEKNSGKAEAVRRGMMQAVNGEPAAVGFWDADLATPLAEVDRFEKLLEEQEELEVVIGSRVKLLGRKIERRASRHYLGRVAATLVSVSLALPVYDTQCGAKLFRNRGLIETAFAEPFLSRWLFDVEVLIRYRRSARAAGASLEQLVVEYPLHSWQDVHGSKVGPLDFVRTLVDLMRIVRRYGR
jgi:dolichyl-phosphate beta-glucosyltransferase